MRHVRLKLGPRNPRDLEPLRLALVFRLLALKIRTAVPQAGFGMPPDFEQPIGQAGHQLTAVIDEVEAGDFGQRIGEEVWVGHGFGDRQIVCIARHDRQAGQDLHEVALVLGPADDRGNPAAPVPFGQDGVGQPHELTVPVVVRPDQLSDSQQAVAKPFADGSDVHLPGGHVREVVGGGQT